MVTSGEVMLIREKLQLTQADLAALVGSDVRTIGRWERCEATPGGAPAELLRVYLWVTRHPARLDKFNSLLADCPSRTLGELLTFLIRSNL